MAFTNENINWDENDENQNVPEAYGWFELGGATTENTFKDITQTDIVLRTADHYNKIVFGNTIFNSNDNAAAMYIKNNKLGINKIPSDDYVLDINGDVKVNKKQHFILDGLTPRKVNYEIEMNASNIKFMSQIDSSENTLMSKTLQTNMELSSLGLLHNKLVISDAIHLDKNNIITNVHIRQFSPNSEIEYIHTNGYNLQIGIEFTPFFQKDLVFVVHDLIFIVIDKPEQIATIDEDNDFNLSMNVRLFLKELNTDEMPLKRDTFVNINILDTLDSKVQNNFREVFSQEPLQRILNVNAYEYFDNFKKIKLKITIDDQSDGFFIAKSYYHFKLLLPDQTLDLDEQLNNILFLDNVDPIIIPGNITQMELTLKGVDEDSDLRRYMYQITTNIDEDIGVEIETRFFPLDVPILFGTDSPQFITLKIEKGENFINNRQVVYQISQEQNSFLFNFLLNLNYNKDFINDALFISEASVGMSGSWTIEKFEIDGLTSGKIYLRNYDFAIEDSMISLINQERMVKVLLFRVRIMNRLGNVNNDSFTPFGSRLAIATNNCSEHLTVNGSASVRENFIIHNTNSYNPFQLQYYDNNLRINIDNLLHDKLKESKFSVDENDYDKLRFIDICTYKSRKTMEQQESHSHDVLVNADVHHARNVSFGSASFIKGGQNISQPFFNIDENGICSIHKEEGNENVVINSKLNAYGHNDSKLITSQSFGHEIHSLTSVEVIHIRSNEITDDLNKRFNGIVMTLDFMYKCYLSNQKILQINGIAFIIQKVVVSNLTDFRFIDIYLEWKFSDQRQYYNHSNLPFKQNDNVHMRVFSQIEVAEEITFIPVSLKYSDGYMFKKDDLGKNVFLNVSGVISKDNVLFLNIGRFYCLKSMGLQLTHHQNPTLDNIVLLKSISRHSETSFILEFKAIDNITDLKEETSIGDIFDALENEKNNGNEKKEQVIYIFPLNSFFQPNKRQFPYNEYELSKYPYQQILENNIDISFSAEANDKLFIDLRNTKILSKFISHTSKFMVSSIDRLYTEKGVFEVAGLYQIDDYVKVHAKFVNTNYLQTTNDVSISYAFNGIPLKIKFTEYPRGNNSIIFFVQDVDPATLGLLKLYIGNSIYIMDKYNIIWKLLDVFQVNRDEELLVVLIVSHPSGQHQDITFNSEERIQLSNERYIFVVPVGFFNFHKLNSNDAGSEIYCPQRLGVGTKYIRETLTVDGTMSCKDHSVMYNDKSIDPFTMSYSNDVFNLGDNLKLSKSKVTIETDFDLNGVISAQNFFTISDESLKKNIERTNQIDDLRLINDINIHNFDFISEETKDKKSQKGVIAQEIENILPEIVKSKYGLIPCIKRRIKCVFKDGKQILKLSLRESKKCSSSGNVFKPKDHDFKIDYIKNILSLIKKDIVIRIVETCVITGTMQKKGSKKKITHDVKVENVKNSNNIANTDEEFSMYIDVANTFDPLSQLHILGVCDNHKIVDHTFLFMTNISALKALNAEVERLKQEINMLKLKNIS
jgi:hypothetical protein